MIRDDQLLSIQFLDGMKQRMALYDISGIPYRQYVKVNIAQSLFTCRRTHKYETAFIFCNCILPGR